ncbi:MAG: peptidoglycan DD-metalloendopeptidase family protein [Phormidium sp.]
MSLPTTDSQWDQASGDDILFDGNTSNRESSAEVKQVFTNLSTAILGRPFQMTAGYAYDQSYYNGQGRRWHAGIDIGAGRGTSVKAAVGGTVAWLSGTSDGEVFVGINSDDGRQWVYGHLQSRGNLTNGMRINAGNAIGLVGTPSGGAHLHLEVQTGLAYGGTQGASSDRNFILNATVSPLQAFWQARGGATAPGSPTPGNDNLTGGAGNDNINALGGNDTISGAGGSDTLRGDSGNDIVYGNDGNDLLYGGTGNDTVIGGAGNDVLDGFYYSGLSGNGEVDNLRGDAGADTFVIGDYYGKGYLGNSWAVIQDFSKSQGDKIKVQGSLSQYQLRSGSLYGYSSNDTAIVLSSNTSEVLAVALGVSTSNGSIQLSTRDFITT